MLLLLLFCTSMWLSQFSDGPLEDCMQVLSRQSWLLILMDFTNMRVSCDFAHHVEQCMPHCGLFNQGLSMLIRIRLQQSCVLCFSYGVM